MVDRIAAGITLSQKIVYGVLTPVALLVVVAAVHLFWVSRASAGASEDWNTVILLVYVPIIVGLAALADCWVLFTTAATTKRIFRRGLIVPVLAYFIIVCFTLWLYSEAPRRFPPNTHNQSSNQAMQLTASKPADCALGACRRDRMLRRTHNGLAAADLVSR
jgi:hypothetical protein